MKPVLLVVLQGPYKKGKLRDGWNPSVYLSLLRRSLTGKRLSEAVPRELYEVRITNSNPALVDSPSDVLPPNMKHLRRTLRRVKPNAILACGTVACGAINQLEVAAPVVEMPHPAYRQLPKETTAQVRKELKLIAAAFAS